MDTHPCSDHLHDCDHCYLCDAQGICCASVPPAVRTDLHALLDSPGSLDVLRDCLAQLAGGVPVSSLRRQYAEVVAARRAERDAAAVRLATAVVSTQHSLPAGTPAIQPFACTQAPETTPHQEGGTHHGTP